jgi:hypothetical protein
MWADVSLDRPHDKSGLSTTLRTILRVSRIGGQLAANRSGAAASDLWRPPEAQAASLST